MYFVGFGFGLAYVPVISSIGNSFTGNKREIAFGITVSGAACGTILYPLIIQVQFKHTNY